jgi:hypothetical protein
MSSYDHSTYYDIDVRRHQDAVNDCLERGNLNHRTELWLAVASTGERFARRVVTRSPNAKFNNRWNLASKDKRVLDQLCKELWYTELILVDDVTGVTAIVKYDACVWIELPPRDGGEVYYQMKL